MKSLLIQLLPKLRRFAFSLTGNIADADDLVQSTVERLLRTDDSSSRSTAAYVFKVCKNLWIDEIRKRRVRQAEEFVDSEHCQLMRTTPQEDRIEVNELVRSLESLPEKSREVLSMVAIAGLSYAEVADELKVPIGTIMSRISRARIALADHLRQKESSAEGGSHALH